MKVTELRAIVRDAPDDADVVFRDAESEIDIEYAYVGDQLIGIATPDPQRIPALFLEGLGQ